MSKQKIFFENCQTNSAREHDVGSYISRILEHVTYLDRNPWHKSVVVSHQGLLPELPLFHQHNRRMQITLRRRSSRIRARRFDLWAGSHESEMPSPRSEHWSVKADYVDCRSTLEHIELIQQYIFKFVVVTPAEVFDETFSPLSPRRLEQVMSPKTINLKKLMRQAIRQ